MRVYGFYEFVDEYSNRQYVNARTSGFASVASATAAIKKRGGIGYIKNQSNVVINIVRNGEVIKHEAPF